MSNDLINRQYVGARYVPKIMSEWNKALQYEALSVVTYMGNSFTSKVPVPANIDITNEDYWVNTGNYNAQVEGYRNDVKKIDSKIYYVTPEMFGGSGDGITDNTEAFTNMLKEEKPIQLLPNKVYKISGIVKADIFFMGINGNHSIIEGGRFELNINGSEWTKPYSQPYSYIKNVRFYNSTQIPNLTCIKTGLPIDFERVVFSQYTVALEKIGTYLDHISMKNVIVYKPIGDDYKIKLSGLGDDNYFESCQFDGNKSVRLLSSNGALFVNCIQGEYYINNSIVKFLNCHIEGGHGVHIEDNYSLVNFDSCTFWNSTILPKKATYNKCKMICNSQSNSIGLTTNATIMKGDNYIMVAPIGVYPRSTCELKMFDLINCPNTSHYKSAKCAKNCIVSSTDFESWKNGLGDYSYTLYPSVVPFGLEGGNMPIAKTEYTKTIINNKQYVEFGIDDYIVGGYIHIYRTHNGDTEKAVIPVSNTVLIDFGTNINGIVWEKVDSIPNPTSSTAIFHNGAYFKATTSPNTSGYIWVNTTDNSVNFS